MKMKLIEIFIIKVIYFNLSKFIANLAGRMNEEKRIHLLQTERNELDNENNILRQQLLVRNDEIERLNSKVMELEHETSQVGILKSKIDELMNKNFQKDQTTREKEENMFNYKREVESLRSDIRNMEHIENTLKSEIEDLLDKRKTLEDINQNLKNQICECNIAIRQIASQFDSVKRENMALSMNIEIFRRSEEQLRHENSNLKELINSIESERIHYRAISEQLQKDLAYSKKESASFAANESKLLAYIKPDQYQAPRYDEYYGPSDGNEMLNYQYMLPRNELEGSNTPPRFSAEAYMPAPEDYRQPKPQTSSQEDKSQLKLPMHLASSVSFDYPGQFDQYYKKNQAAGPPPVRPTPVDNRIREGAQKTYFGSNLGNIFDWDNSQKVIQKIPQNHPSAETSQGSQQFP